MRRSLALSIVVCALMLVAMQTPRSRSQPTLQDPAKPDTKVTPQEPERRVVFRRPPIQGRYVQDTFLLWTPGVLTELKVTPDQRKKLDQLATEQSESLHKFAEEATARLGQLPAATDLPAEQREALREEIHLKWRF